MPVISYGFGANTALAGFLACVLAAIAVVDLRTLRIPNRIVLPATAVVLLVRTVLLPASLPGYLLAAVLTATLLLIPSLFNAAWMGMGDVKLGLLLGATLGSAALGALFIAFFACFPVAVALLVRGRNKSLPFGPFMAFGALVVLALPLVGVAG